MAGKGPGDRVALTQAAHHVGQPLSDELLVGIQPLMGAGTKDGSPQDDDVLTETVILRPGKNKGLQDE